VGRLRLVAAPALFLLAVTVGVVVLQSHRHASTPTKPRVVKRTPAPATRRVYRVHAGDTFAGVAAKTHVPLPRLRALNPSVTPSVLFIGEKIRLR